MIERFIRDRIADLEANITDGNVGNMESYKYQTGALHAYRRCLEEINAQRKREMEAEDNLDGLTPLKERV